MGGLSERHLKLIENRGLDAEIVSRHGVETCEDRPDLIRIPYLVGADVVNNKYRTLDGEKRFHQDKDGRKCFYNFNVITDASLAGEPLITVEGEPDVWAAEQAGFTRVVSVPDGAPAEALGDDDSGAKYSYVRDAEPAMRDIKEIILCTDGDPPGINLMNDLAIRFGRARCKWVTYPKGCKDLGDTLRRYGVRGVQETVRRARWVRVDGIYRMSELPPLSNAVAHDSGMPELGRHYRLRLGDFCVVTGVPSHGKTTWVTDLCCRMVQAHGWDVAFASFETQPQIDHRRMLSTWYHRKHPTWHSQEERAEAAAWIDQHFSFICPSDDDDATLPWLLEKAAASVIRHGVRIVVVDPWNEMDHVRPDGISLTEYTGIAIKEFRRFAKKYQVHMIVVAHPTKLAKEKDGTVPMPSMYDISDSAHWANKADVGVIVHRKNDIKTVIRVAKSRYHEEIGIPGQFEAEFSRDQGRYIVHDDTSRDLFTKGAA
jgi:twinkle protein